MIDLVPPPPTLAENKTPDQMVEEAELSHSTNLFEIDGFSQYTSLKCGFPTFETHQYLRDHEPDLVVIAARPGVGKTAFVSQIALEVSKHSQVLFFSAEMTKEQLASRMFSVVTGTPIQKLFKMTTHERNVLNNQLRARRLRVDETNNVSINEIMSRSIDMHARYPLGLIVVDYLQIVSTQLGRSKQEEVLLVASQLKALAKKLGIPVLALAQMNRMIDARMADNPESSPIMSDVADSSGIEKWADVLICLHRPKDFPNRLKGFVLKNRNGVALDFEMKFNGETTRFIDGGEGS